MSWTQRVFAYCERGADPGFWAEPLNALSNAAFLLAAAMALAAWVRKPGESRGGVELVLILLVFVIGIGSFLFHTLAMRWASLADTLPIGAFMLTYLIYALRRFLGLPVLATVPLAALFIAALFLAGSIRCASGPCLNGSLGYAPALAALALVGLLLWLRGHGASGALMSGAGIFAVSLTLRTFDRTACPWTVVSAGRSIGTHFIWHLLNATLLYTLLMGAIRFGGSRHKGAPQ